MVVKVKYYYLSHIKRSLKKYIVPTYQIIQIIYFFFFKLFIQTNSSIYKRGMNNFK